MNVTLYGASGRAGSRILQELEGRNHKVKAVSRKLPAASDGGKAVWVEDDLSDVQKTADTIAGSDAVISAYAPPPDNVGALIAATSLLADAVAKAGVARLLVVGGAGGLEVAPGVTLLQSGHLPEEWRAIATAHGETLAALQRTSIDWTYIAPAGFFEPGERTGHYRTASHQLVVAANGESRISMEDYAIAMVDELELNKHPHQRFAVGW